MDQPIIDYIVNVLADDDFDFGFQGEGAVDAIGELLVDSGCVSDDAECRSVRSFSSFRFFFSAFNLLDSRKLSSLNFEFF